VFVARLQDQVSLVHESAACSNVADSVHVARNNVEFFLTEFDSFIWAILMTINRRKKMYALWSSMKPAV
jgi:hypothetical protein